MPDEGPIETVADLLDIVTPRRPRELPVSFDDFPTDHAREFDLDEVRQFFDLKAEGYGDVEIGLSLGWSPAMVRRFVGDPERSEILTALEERRHETMERAVHRAGLQGNVQAMKLWLYSQAQHRGWADNRSVRVDVQSQREIVVSVRQAVHEKTAELVADRGEDGVAALQRAFMDDDDVVDAEVVGEAVHPR